MPLLLALLLQSAAVPAPAVRFEPFELKTFDGRVHQVESGRLTVPERRDTGASRSIEIAFVRLPSRTSNPGAPIVFLAGGPGVPGSVMGQVPIYFQLFDRLRDVADVILLDQRGTGRSMPLLDCPPTESLPTSVFADEATAFNEIMRRARSCASILRARGIDLSAYHSDAIAADLEDLRRALGVERLNLLAFSYGTEIAVQAARVRPDTLHRVVFSGTRGPDHLMRLPSVLDTHIRKLAYLERQQRPHALDLDLVEVLQAIIDRLRQAPASVTITDRRVKRPVNVTAGAIAVQALLQGEISDGRGIAGVPRWLRALHAGDHQAFAGRLEQLYHGLATPPMFGTAVNCAAGWSPERESQATRESRTAMLGRVMNFLARRDLCDAIGVRPLGAAFLAPVSSPVHSLFLSGTLDAQTPPMQAEQVRFGFPHSAHVIVENGSHEVLPVEDVQRTVVEFFRGEEVRDQRLSVPPPKFEQGTSDPRR